MKTRSSVTVVGATVGRSAGVGLTACVGIIVGVDEGVSLRGGDDGEDPALQAMASVTNMAGKTAHTGRDFPRYIFRPSPGRRCPRMIIDRRNLG